MILFRPAFRCVPFLLATCLTTQLVLAQDWRELTGYNRLRNEVGQSLENGAGISVSLVEAGGANFNFMPDVANAEFAGKVISNGTGTANGTSGHATSVAQVLFGSTSSIATGVTNVTAYDAGDWIINRNNLGQAGLNPLANPFSVQNHSYIADGLAVPVANEALARMDYIINRDGVTSTVGMNNGASNTLPQLFGQSYNSISVGLTNGAHSNGTTTLGTSGRIKPDIVAPAGVTSLATPMVGATAAVLHQKAVNMGAAGADARQPEAMKAIIMAGATKTQFANWDQVVNANVITRPLDETFGAGQLNVYNSYKILEGGEFDGNLTNSQGDSSLCAVGITAKPSLQAIK